MQDDKRLEGFIVHEKWEQCAEYASIVEHKTPDRRLHLPQNESSWGLGLITRVSDNVLLSFHDLPEMSCSFFCSLIFLKLFSWKSSLFFHFGVFLSPAQ